MLCLKFSFVWLELEVLKLHGHSHVSRDLQFALEKCLLTKKWENGETGDYQFEINFLLPVGMEPRDSKKQGGIVIALAKEMNAF